MKKKTAKVSLGVIFVALLTLWVVVSPESFVCFLAFLALCVIVGVVMWLIHEVAEGED